MLVKIAPVRLADLPCARRRPDPGPKYCNALTPIFHFPS